MKLSVAMCTYNGARFLTEQLESILAQTRTPDELVVCDDCSIDETRNLLEHFAATTTFPVRLYYNDHNVGSTRNFEKAIRLCKGDVIALCDQDDIWRPQKLERCETVLANRSDVGLVFSDGDIVDQHGAPEGLTLWQSLSFDRELQQKMSTAACFEVLNQRTAVTGTTMVFRAQFKDLVLPIPEDISLIHDAWIALVISTTAELFAVAEPLISYRRHNLQQVGIGHRDRTEKTATLLEAARRKTALWPEINKLRAVRDRLAAKRGSYEFKVEHQIAMQLKHLETRASISGRKVVNAPYVLREFITWRYHRYSNGFYSALKDLLC